MKETYGIDLTAQDIDWSKLPEDTVKIELTDQHGRTFRVIHRPQPVNLTLTPEQADALAMVLNRVGGHPRTTPRGHIQKIQQLLSAAGYRGDASLTQLSDGSIYFVG